MATFTITSTRNFDSIDFVSRTGSDTYNITGAGKLIINTDTRYCLNSDATKGNMGILAIDRFTTGGEIFVDGTSVRIIPFSSGGGLVPAIGTTISQGATTSALLGVFPNLASPPTAAAAAMPASGWIKVKDKVGNYSSGALTGITATATGPDRVGWIEVVAAQSINFAFADNGTFRASGDWFTLPGDPSLGGGDLLTTGLDSTTYQIPASLAETYWGGVWVETGPGTSVYKFFPAFGASGGDYVGANTVATDDHRGSLCWISTQGLLRLGSDGTNRNGYLPPAGCRIRVPNINFIISILASAANVVPNSTLASRPEFLVSSGGNVILSNVNSSWYMNFLNGNQLQITDSSILDAIIISRYAKSKPILSNVGIGGVAHATGYVSITATLCSQGLDLIDVVAMKPLPITNAFIITLLGNTNINMTRVKAIYPKPAIGTNYYHSLSQNDGVSLISCSGIGAHGGSLTDRNTNIYIKDYDYTSVINGTTDVTLAGSAWSFTRDVGLTIDGLSFGGGGLSTRVAPVNSVFLFGAGMTNTVVKNIGSPSSPLNLGGPDVSDVSYTHVTLTTTSTINTPSAHGLKSGDTIFITRTTDTAVNPVGTLRTVTVLSTTSFTIPCSAGAGTTGTVSYSQAISNIGISLIQANGNIQDTLVRSVYFNNTRSVGFQAAQDTDGLDVRGVWVDAAARGTTEPHSAFNANYRGVRHRSNFAASTTIAGSHFVDNHFGDLTSGGLPVNATWTRSGTTLTVTATSHNMITGDGIMVTVCSDVNAEPLGYSSSITVLDSSTFTVPCNNTGALSGTLTYENVASYVLFMTGYSPSPQSTARGDVRDTVPTATYSNLTYTAVAPGVQTVWQHPDFILGHTGFHNTLPLYGLSGADALTAWLYEYQINKNDGYGFSGWKNAARALSCTLTGGGTAITVADSSLISVGDRVLTTTSTLYTGYDAQVVSIDSPTQVTVSVPHIASGASVILNFNALPGEVLDPSRGFKLKLRRTTLTTNASSTLAVRFFTKSTTSSRDIQYPESGPVYEWPLLSFGIPVGRTFIRPPAPRGFIVPPIITSP